MIRRACWLGGVGAFSSLLAYGIARLDAPFPIVATLGRTAPGIILWLVFRRQFTGRSKSRLVALLVLFWFAPIIVWLLLGSRFGNYQIVTPRYFFAILEAMRLIFLACTVPLALGTPSYFGPAFRLFSVAVITCGVPVLILQRPAFIAGSPFDWYSFGILFGLPAIKFGLLFAALAPDHIAMERAAQSRKTLPNCEACAYDLTGNVSGVCPECGTALSEAVRQRLQQPIDLVPPAGHASDSAVGKAGQ